MFDYANTIILNKSDKIDAKDSFKDIQKIYRNIHKIFDIASDKLPIFLTNTRNFNNAGINKLFSYLFQYLKITTNKLWSNFKTSNNLSVLYSSNYLKYIIDTILNYKKNVNKS